MTTDIRERVAEVLTNLIDSQYVGGKRSDAEAAAWAVLEAFPQLAEPVEWEWGVRDAGGRLVVDGLKTRGSAGVCAIKPGDVIVRRRRAGEWEKAE